MLVGAMTTKFSSLQISLGLADRFVYNEHVAGNRALQILFVHGNYPAQFHWLAELLGRQGKHDVRFLTAREDATSLSIPGVRVELFAEHTRDNSSPSSSYLTQSIDNAIALSSTIADRLRDLAGSGFAPRLVIFHGGRGLGLLIKEVLPSASVIGYFEWYFNPSLAKDLLGRNDRLTRHYLELRNLATCQELVNCDSAVVPTGWQANQFPELLRTKLQVIFDGIDPRLHHPFKDNSRDWPAKFEGESGTLELAANEILITYATRGMEPLRGFPEFMRALPFVLNNIPSARVLIAGRDRSAYGPVAPSHNGSWKEMILDELGAFSGLERITFTGLLPRNHYVKMLQRTNLHCYFTRPYVPSWSFFEAVACQAPLLASDGGATTETLPDTLMHLISIDSSPTDMAAAMIKILRTQIGQPKEAHCNQTTLKSSLPPWIWRSQSMASWQELINENLAKTKARPRR